MVSVPFLVKQPCEIERFISGVRGFVVSRLITALVNVLAGLAVEKIDIGEPLAWEKFAVIVKDAAPRDA